MFVSLYRSNSCDRQSVLMEMLFLTKKIIPVQPLYKVFSLFFVFLLLLIRRTRLLPNIVNWNVFCFGKKGENILFIVCLSLFCTVEYFLLLTRKVSKLCCIV